MFKRVYPKQLNPPTSQQLCLLCRTSWRTNPWANYRSGNIGLDVHRQRECPKLGIAVKMHGNTGERFLRFAVTCATNIFKCTVLNFAAWTCYPRNLCRNHQEKRRWVAKTNASKLFICRLENWRFHFSICYAKQLITWQNLASEGNRKWQRWLWSDFRKEFPLYVHGFHHGASICPVSLLAVHPWLQTHYDLTLAVFTCFSISIFRMPVSIENHIFASCVEIVKKTRYRWIPVI